jgi:ribokinase
VPRRTPSWRARAKEADVDESTPAAVLVVGSVNHDITVLCPRLPAPGETVLGDSVSYGLGGKGANQAVAVARAGVAVRLLATVGADPAGDRLRDLLRGYGVDVSLLRTSSVHATGTAHITVDAAGENCIVVVPGANATTSAEHVRDVAGTVATAGVVVLQSEIPASTVVAVLDLLADAPARVVLNLAPVVPLPLSTLARADVLVVNETETGQVLGTPPPASAEEAGRAARQLVETVGAAVVTLGAAGAVVVERGGEPVHLPSPMPARVVDTTGAGDALVGVLAAGLATGAGLVAATRAAVAAASRTVEAVGAAPSYPRFDLPH